MLAPGEASSISDSDVLSYFSSLSNWGRWGETDTLGTLNLITADRIVEAAHLIETGLHVSCSRSVGLQAARIPTRSVIHLMTRSGADSGIEGFGSAADWIGVGLHGFEYTHLDAHSHVFWKGQMYNGRSKDLVTTERGALAGGLEPVFDGITSRGILVDGPSMTGGGPLAPGTAIEAKDLDDWYEKHGIEAKPGDVLYVRTGNQESNSESYAGLDASCLPWLHSAGVSVLASDGINDVVPTPYKFLKDGLPVHAVGIAAMGMWLIDNAALDRLAATCAELGRYEFMTFASPIPLRRATGSLINPVAIF